MLTARTVLRAGLWGEKPIDSVTLDYDRRTRRRIALTGAKGLSFLLDLAEAPILRTGDGLKLEDGRVIEVRAAPEALLEITCADELALARIAWHLGNRHLATEIDARVLHIRTDHVIEDMVVKLGAAVQHVQRPFNPEGGAYGHGAVSGHSHGHGHSHAHGHAHDHHH
jgi:urease accessory protein